MDKLDKRAKMSYHSTPDWNPQDAAVLHDQRRAYDEMRERCPVAHSDFLGWSLFRHQDIVAVLADPATYSNATKHPAIPNGLNPPEHTSYRRILEPYFQPEQMTTFEPLCRSIAVDVIQALSKQDELEFISEFAQPFSLKTHCAFLGWPLETWERLSSWTQATQAVAFSRDSGTGAMLAQEFARYVTEALQIRRAVGTTATNDLTTSLIRTTVDGAPLSDEEIVSILRNWTAGHGTIVAALGILVFYLAEHPTVQQQLRDEPDRLPVALDEILRADGPLVANPRTVVHDAEIGGQKIKAGEKLSLNWIAANRDARTFDAPDEVRFDRDPTQSMLFGAGIHNCLGAPLARLVMRVALKELLARTVTISLSSTEPPSRAVYPSNGFEAMSVNFRWGKPDDGLPISD